MADDSLSQLSNIYPIISWWHYVHIDFVLVFFQIFLGRLSRWMCLAGAPYTALPQSDLAPRDDNPSQLRVDSELGDIGPLPRSPTLALEKTLDEIRRYLRMCANQMTAAELTQQVSHKQLVLNEWHQLALVIDRLMFWGFTLITILVTISMYAH